MRPRNLSEPGLRCAAALAQLAYDWETADRADGARARGQERRMQLRLATRTEGDSTIVSVGGEIDNFTAPQLWDALVDAFDGAARTGVIDLSDTDFLDSSGLGVIVGISKQQQAKGASLRIVCPKPHLRKLFVISHLDEVVSVCETIEQAT